MRQDGGRGGRVWQRGALMPLMVLGILAVLAVATLAIDLGMAFVMRSRLQAALDAAALSGAKTLNEEGRAAAVAEADTLYKADMCTPPEPSNCVPAPQVETSAALVPFADTITNPRFVRVSATAPVPVYFLGVLALFPGGAMDALTVSGAAIAGPKPLNGELCGAIGLGVCGDPTPADGDTDCSDGPCYGLGAGEIAIKSPGHSLGPGNYGLMVMNCSGAACIRENFAGGTDFCFEPGGSRQTEPGAASGPTAAGLNTSFGVYQGGLSATDFPPDKVTASGITYQVYTGRLENGPKEHPVDGVARRRVVLLPIMDCDPPINGRRNAPILDGSCLFLTRLVDNSNGTVYGELVDECRATGGGGAPEPLGGGPYTIVLYPDTA